MDTTLAVLNLEETINVEPARMSDAYNEVSSIHVMIEVINFWTRQNHGC